MTNEKMPGRRLITQNMLSSASLFEREKHPGWSSLQDLSAFIDLFCLYDKAVVLGRGGEIALKGWGSDFLALLTENNFVDVEYPYETGEENISLAASKHLITFLGSQESTNFHRLLAYAMQPGAAFSLEATPDASTEIKIGEEWLLTSPTREELLEQLRREQEAVRGTTFVLRTFLYLAYADVGKLAFTPDAVRVPILDAVLDREEQFRGKLLSTLQLAWEATPGDKEVLHRVSPFSAIVFARAYPDRGRIVPIMADLRNQLAPVRKRFRDLEDRLLWRSRDDALAAQEEWNGVLKELETNFGAESQLVNLRKGLNFGEKVGSAIENPTSLKAWFETLSDLPAQTATRLINRRPVVELHRLRQELPASSRLNDTILRLFEPKPA